MNKTYLTFGLVLVALVTILAFFNKNEVQAPKDEEEEVVLEEVVAEVKEPEPQEEEQPEPEPETEPEPVVETKEEPVVETPVKAPMPEMSEEVSRFYRSALRAVELEVLFDDPNAIVDIHIDSSNPDNYILTVNVLSGGDISEVSPYYVVEHIQADYPDMLFKTYYTEYNLSKEDFAKYHEQYGPNVNAEVLNSMKANRYYLPIEFSFD